MISAQKVFVAAVAFMVPSLGTHADPVIFGKLHLSMDRTDNDGGTPSSKNGYFSNNISRIGIKGDEDIGGGLKAIYQVLIPIQSDGETGLSSDQTSAGTNQGTNRVNIATMNTFLGLVGSFGRFQVGKQDMLPKTYGRNVDLFNERVGDSRNAYMATFGPATPTANQLITEGNFSNNAIVYSSPTFFGGLAVEASYSTGENNSTTAQPTVSAIGVIWRGGNLMVGATKADNHGVDASNESLLRVVASYKLGNLGLYGLYDDQSNVGNVLGSDRTVTGIGATYKMGSNTFKLQNYGADKFGDSTATTKGGGSVLAAAVDHSFSKSTTLYLAYAKASNDANATAFRVNGFAHGEVVSAAAAGKSPSAVSAGLEVFF